MGGYLHGMGACLHGPRIDQTEYWLRHNWILLLKILLSIVVRTKTF
jgi:hypothetical protein